MNKLGPSNIFVHQKKANCSLKLYIFYLSDNNIALVINFGSQGYCRIIYLTARFLSYILQLYRGNQEEMNWYFLFGLEQTFHQSILFKKLLSCFLMEEKMCCILKFDYDRKQNAEIILMAKHRIQWLIRQYERQYGYQDSLLTSLLKGRRKQNCKKIHYCYRSIYLLS